MSEETIFIGVLVLVTIVVTVIVVLRMAGGRVAEVVAQPDVPFELSCAPVDSKKYSIGLDFELTVAGQSPDMYGLACKLTAEVEGTQVLDEVVGVGYRGRAAGPVTKDRKSLFKQGTTRLADGCRISMSATLIRLGPRVHSSKIVVRGVISTTDNVDVHSLNVFLKG